jgi:hypothetical protein
MALELSLKLNNQIVTDYTTPIRVVEGSLTLNWSFDLTDRVSVNTSTGVISGTGQFAQSGYEIRIATSSTNIGTDIFVGNIAQTGYLTGQESFWRYEGTILDRGSTYYGQIYSIDEANRQSEWATFSFTYNSLPLVANVAISPAQPSTTDDLQLDYTFSDGDSDLESGTKIRWFKNGSYQKQFDDATIIESSYLQNNDVWNADVYPSDGYEYGSRVTSSQIIIAKTAVTISNINILPKNPTIDDILKANYLASDEIEKENVLIRWYVNDLLVSGFNDQQYVKLSIEEDDEVRFEIRHEEADVYTSSPVVTVVASDFIISDIIVDGKIDSLDISAITPLVQWKTFAPDNKEINYISIKIGTFYESNNVYSTTLSYSSDSFIIPPNILNKGRDYYISIAASDTQTFSRYTSSHFRITGCRWEESVSNSNGWTLEMLFLVPDDGTEDTHYHVIRINDGTKFAEVRLYTTKIVLISGSRIEYDNVNKFGASTLTIAGQLSDIKIYLDRNIIINGEGIFTQESNIKRLEIGALASSTFSIYYKYLFYTTSGYFLPGLSGEYANIQFHTYMEFEDNEVVALNSYINGQYIFGLNPDDITESSKIYAMVPGESIFKCATVPRTFSPINKIRKSPDGKIIVYAHAKGVTIMRGYDMGQFNKELIFVDSNGTLDTTFPNNNGWELVRNTNFNAAYFDDDGFHINTLGAL